MAKTYFFTSLILVSVFFLSCKKDQKIEPENPVIVVDKQPSAVFNFKAIVNNLPLIPNTKWYANANGDSFTVTKFNYYISNIKLKLSDGSIFSEVESYHIIKNVEGVNSFTIANLPEGTYNQIEFLIGVDSLRNVSGAQTGDLSPDSLMFWDWSSGYIFFKFEGHKKTSTMPIEDSYAMHIGGFSGPDNFIKKCTFNLSSTLIASKNKQSKVFYNVNIDEIFINPLLIDFDTYSVVGGGKKAQDISDNYKDMFSIDHIEN
ncbi:MAG: hypothetical protein Q7W45_04725 [Bacteroidota bacterium]|nr:hypothetical protein [Bacteroidota bacterium]MDP3144749.1 hypothetical protein [Bacteroidota bacterium]